MDLNEKLSKEDIEYLDGLYEIAKRHVDDFEYFKQQVELILSELESPIEWYLYTRKFERIGRKGDK